MKEMVVMRTMMCKLRNEEKQNEVSTKILFEHAKSF